MVADSRESSLLTAADCGDAGLVKRLLDEGVDPGCADDEGVTPLMKAAEAGHAAVVSFLLEAGAPWNAQDKEGYCAGEYALRQQTDGMRRTAAGTGACSASLSLEQHLGTSSEAASVSPANADYLKQKLVYDGDKLLDADGEAVMMGWEEPLMRHHADIICSNGGDILNVGFGLGLVDQFIQEHTPRSHTIIEAHPDVYAHMLELGWDKKPGVRILHGRWQDVLQQLGRYDGIFFDTYGEYYEELRDFHLQLPNLLKPTGTYSFFNGVASDNIFFHLVYGRLIQIELETIGISTSYEPAQVTTHLQPDVWQGVKNKYWHFDMYFYPAAARKKTKCSRLQTMNK